MAEEERIRRASSQIEGAIEEGAPNAIQLTRGETIRNGNRDVTDFRDQDGRLVVRMFQTFNLIDGITFCIGHINVYAPKGTITGDDERDVLEAAYFEYGPDGQLTHARSQIDSQGRWRRNFVIYGADGKQKPPTGFGTDRRFPNQIAPPTIETSRQLP